MLGTSNQSVPEMAIDICIYDGDKWDIPSGLMMIE